MVNSDYLRNARRADIEYNGHDRNNPLDGPIARRLKEYAFEMLDISVGEAFCLSEEKLDALDEL